MQLLENIRVVGIVVFFFILKFCGIPVFFVCVFFRIVLLHGICARILFRLDVQNDEHKSKPQQVVNASREGVEGAGFWVMMSLIGGVPYDGQFDPIWQLAATVMCLPI